MARRGPGRTTVARQRARELKERLAQDEFREAVQFTDADIEALDLISSGKPPRNAFAIISGLRLKAEFAYSKPKQEIEVTGSLELVERLRRGLKRSGRVDA